MLCRGGLNPATSPDGLVFVKQRDDSQSILLSSSGDRYAGILDDSQHVSGFDFHRWKMDSIFDTSGRNGRSMWPHSEARTLSQESLDPGDTR